MSLDPASLEDLTRLADLALAAAADAAALIARSRPMKVEHKDGGASLASQVVTEIDRQSEALIIDALSPSVEAFGLGLLTEEQADDGSRFTADAFWCIDPLDGTLPFIEGTPGYAVSIALVARDGTPLVGVVHDPVDRTALHAIRGGGAFHNGDPWQPTPVVGDLLSVFADRSFIAHPAHEEVLEQLECVADDVGLAGLAVEATAGGVLNACRVFGNPPACYLKFPAPRGGGGLWDFAATACLFHEAGAVATDVFGAPLDLNRADSTAMNHRGVLYASDEQLAARLRRIVPPA